MMSMNYLKAFTGSLLLSGLLAYQEKMRRERRESLDRMAQDGQAAGLYEATAGPVPRTR